MWSSASFISIENLTNSTWKFVIKPNDNFKYAPGQFIQIKIKDIVRSYSIASYNLSENIFELLIVKLEGGIMTKILFEEINEGDKLEIKGPIGRFTLPEKIDGISTLDLSLSKVIKGSLIFISSPCFTNISMISTFSKSPISGTVIFVAIIDVLFIPQFNPFSAM